MQFNIQKTVKLDYMLLPPDQGASSVALLVNSPDGVILEFQVNNYVAANLDAILSDNNLWNAFFTSIDKMYGASNDNS